MRKYQVRGYPTLKVFGNGQEYKTFQGEFWSGFDGIHCMDCKLHPMGAGSRDLSSLKSFVEKAAKELTTETTE